MSQSQSLKQYIESQVGDEVDIVPDEFSNLILDDHPLAKISAEDMAYLNQFTNLTQLQMNRVGLTSLDNLPASAKLVRLELADNQLEAAELEKLTVYKETLLTLKVGNNKITSAD